jgi:hypothetical protein
MHDIYCQLVPNDEDANMCYDMIPRIGAFEVSYKGIILFSKMMSSVWPHFSAVAKYVDSMFNDMRSMSLPELTKKYTTTGKVMVAPRQSKPLGNTAKSMGGQQSPRATLKEDKTAEEPAAKEEGAAADKE